jgi:hypothetical protein
MGRQGRRLKQLLDDLMEMRGHWKFKEETLDPLCGELTFEKDMDLSQDRLQNEWMDICMYEWMNEWMNKCVSQKLK